MFAGILLEVRLTLQGHEVEEGDFFENDPFKLEAAPLKHPVPCTGYAFKEKDKRHIKIQAIRKIGIPEGPKIGELQKGKAITWNNKKINPKDVSTKIKGKKISFITDTKLTQNCYKLAKDADILVIEGTFTNKLKDKANAHGHLTAEESAQIAAKANVKKLILTHFSARYKNTSDIEEEARTIFNNTICAQDFMKITI